MLDHVGAKSGIERTAPLLYVEDGGSVVIVAPKGGFPQHPAWFHNLKASPDTTVLIGAERRAVHARLAKPEERERLWEKAIRSYRPYVEYQQRSKGREIPLVVLEPRLVPARRELSASSKPMSTSAIDARHLPARTAHGNDC